MPIENVIISGPKREIMKNLSTGQVTSDVSFTVTQAKQFYSNKTKGSVTAEPSGWRSPAPYKHYVTISSRPRGKWMWRHGMTEVTVEGYWAGSEHQPVWQNYDLSLKQAAEIEALLQLKDQRVNLAQAWGERDQLARLVGDTATRLARAYKAARARRFRDAVKHLGAKWRGTPRNWLELQYAWKPLLGDVHGVVQEIQDIPPHRWLVTVKGTSQRRWTETSSLTANGGAASFYATDKHFQGGFVRLDYHPDDDFMILVRRLGLSNPLTLAWELLPYSFVVDWLWPVGDWTSSLDAAIGFNFKSGSFSRIRKVSRTLSPSWENENPSFQQRWAEFEGGTYRGSELIRTLYASSPLPRPPSTKNPASLSHMANGLSLLAEAFGRGR